VARILSKDGGKYTPHPLPVLQRALTYYDRNFYKKDGAIQNPAWQVNRIDFQPYPFPSYTEELVRLLKTTRWKEIRIFSKNCNPDRWRGISWMTLLSVMPCNRWADRKLSAYRIISPASRRSNLKVRTYEVTIFDLPAKSFTPLWGIGLGLLLWWLFTSPLWHSNPILNDFSPERSFVALLRLFVGGEIMPHILTSCRRVLWA